ncbi:MAG: hypothetical protein WCW14_00100 [Candidatus Paceibacterota bacterium]|jgi:hypothetical protein
MKKSPFFRKIGAKTGQQSGPLGVNPNEWAKDYTDTDDPNIRADLLRLLKEAEITPIQWVFIYNVFEIWKETDFGKPVFDILIEKGPQGLSLPQIEELSQQNGIDVLERISSIQDKLARH